MNPVLEDLFRRFGIDPIKVGQPQTSLPQYSPLFSNFNTEAAGAPKIGRPSDAYSARNINELETNRLQSQVARQGNMAMELTGEEHNPVQPGTLERVFDILSRPNYAMAEGTRQVIKQNKEQEPRSGLGRLLDFNVLGDFSLGDVDDFAKGAWQGLQGREKTNFNKTLQEAGMEKSPLSAILGFVGDVALDPTTYLTAGTTAAAKGALTTGGRGIAKRTIQEAAEGYAAGAVREIIEDPTNIKAVDDIVQNALQQKVATGLRKGGPKVKQPTAKSLRKEADRKFADDLFNLFEAQKDEFIRQNERTFNLRFAGKNLLPDSLSRKIYDVASDVTSPLFDSRKAQAFQAMFSPRSNYGMLHAASRIHEGQGIAAFEKNLEEFREMVKGLSRQESKDISLALENGTLLSGEAAEIQKSVRKLLDDFWTDEVARGLHKDKPYRDNYVPHYYQKGDRKITEFNSRVKNQVNRKMGAEHARQFDLLKQAQDAGLKPIMDIREIVARRAADHYRKMSALNFLDEVSSKYGITLKSEKGKTLRGSKQLMQKFKKAGIELEPFKLRHLDNAEFYFPKEVVGVLRSLDQTIYRSEAASEIFRSFDKVQNALKTGFTVLVPGHHVRNLVGDVFLNFEDGVVNPKRYAEAARIAAGRTAGPNSKLREELANKFMMIGGKKYSYWDISQLYDEMGLRSGFFDVELARGSGRSAKHPVEAARSLATTREDTARIAHFIDVLKKRGKQNPIKHKYEDIRKLGYEAAERVRKFNLDYGDLTKTEKDVARRMFLFYTFLRKNLPLQLEMMATRPGRVQAVTDLENLIEGIAGIENDDPRLEQSIPDWIREMGAIQLTDGRNPVFSTIQFPTADINRVSTNPQEVFSEFISMLTPFAKVPIELGMQKQAFSGAPVGDTADYGVNQVPFGSLLRKQAESISEGEGLDVPAILNLLTGAGIQPVTEERRRGELRRQQDILQSVISEVRRGQREELFPK